MLMHGDAMNKLGEVNWLKKRIAEYKQLVKSGEITKDEADEKMKFLELRLEELRSVGSKV